MFEVRINLRTGHYEVLDTEGNVLADKLYLEHDGEVAQEMGGAWVAEFGGEWGLTPLGQSVFGRVKALHEARQKS